MNNSSKSVPQSVSIVSENEPVVICPTVEVLPQGIVLCLGNLNLFMSEESAMELSDLLVEGAMVKLGVPLEEDFIQ